MKKLLFTFCLAMVASLGYSQIVVSGNIDINGTTTWTNNNIYILSGFVKVTSNDTLVIQPGTIIKGDLTTKGTLVIERGGYIHAVGTPEMPIVMTSQKAAGQRSYGDWGGLILCGRASVNQPANAGAGTSQGEAIVEGGVGSIYGGGTTPNDDDNSGIVRYVRIEFGGIPFQPNSEINGLTFCGVGRGTQVDHVQVSYVGDDAFEWFGGTVNVHHIVAYRNWDDDFDTDFGFRGNVQFALSVRDPQIADQSGSNGFESDNDATGSVYVPNTQPHFSNVTIVGPYAFSSTINSNFKRGFHLRRNTECSVFNSVVMGYPTGLLIESASTQGKATNGLLKNKNNVVVQMNDTLATTTAANPNNINAGFNISNWFNTAAFSNTTYNNVTDLGFNSVSLINPDFTLQPTSPLQTGADFSDAYLTNSFFTPVAYRGAFGTEDWTSCWTEWDPQNADYSVAVNNTPNVELTAAGNVEICAGNTVVLNANSTDANTTFAWSNGTTGASQEIASSGSYSVVATNAAGCTINSNTIDVVVNENPTVAISANGNTSFCTGGSVVLSSSQTGNNVWNDGTQSNDLTVTTSGSYSLTFTDNNGCSAASNSIDVNVSDSPAPTVSTSGSTTICSGSSVTLTSSPADSYSWELNGNVISSAASIDASEAGLYTVTVTNANACDGTGTSAATLVLVNASPTADATFTQNYGSYTVQFLNNSLNATSYLWNFGDGTTSTSANPNHTYATGGDYTVTLTASNGSCTDVFTINLTSVDVTEAVAFDNLAVYPNPVEDVLNIQFNATNNEMMNVMVYDITGNVVFATRENVNAGTTQMQIDLSAFQAGIYLVSMNNETSNVLVKVVKK
jgi:PKD repeat protein